VPQVNGGGSADGNRGGGNTGSGSTSTGFSQGGGESQASSIRSMSQIVVAGSALIGLFVGGMFMLL
jgi:hypothetical protein